MVRLYEIALTELEDAKAELADIQAMSEEKACSIYKVDSKAEIVNEISHDIEYLKNEVDRLTPVDFNSDTAIDIFGSYAAMDAFLY